MKQSIQFIGLIFVLVVIINVSGESCQENNCLTPNECESVVRGGVTCPKKGDACCEIVKEEFRTKCSQSQGHCTKSNCPPSIRVARQRSQDCAPNENCCVLVN